LPITQWCSISDVLFSGGRGVSDFSVLKYYKSNINYITFFNLPRPATATAAATATATA